jgi:hypothetical protein
VSLKGVRVYDVATSMELLISARGIKFSHHPMFLVGLAPFLLCKLDATINLRATSDKESS